MTAGPCPVLSNAISAPSFEITFCIKILLTSLLSPRIFILLILSLGAGRVEERHQSREQLLRGAEKQEMIGAGEDGELRVGNEPVHLNRMLGANRIMIAHHDQRLRLDRLEFGRRKTVEVAL